MKHLWVILFLLFVGCEKKKEVVTNYFSNGQQKLEATWKNGKLEGKTIQWFSNGQKQFEGNYRNGKRDGLWTSWKENGKKRQNQYFKNEDGIQEIQWTWWHENGQMAQRWDEVNGKTIGKLIEWYEDGQKKRELAYKDGELISKQCWDENSNECVCYPLPPGGCEKKKKTDTLKLINESFISTENGFAINFPGEVEIDRLDEYTRAFTSFELIKNDYIFYQVQIMDERPGVPLKFDTQEQHHFFLRSFLQASQLLYENPKNIYTEISLYKDKYYSLNYKFSGLWMIVESGLPVYNLGTIIMHNRRIKRVTLIYSKSLETSPLIRKKYADFVGSLRLIGK